MRGDPPVEIESLSDGDESTPHARGSTPGVIPGQKEEKVYPACAGIHLKVKR